MVPYQERVVTEQNELTEKLVKLRQFIATDEFHLIDDHERSLLMAQAHHMASYSDTLAQRIVLFSK